jgi:hypothetical protein
MTNNINAGYGVSLLNTPFGAGKVFHVARQGSDVYNWLAEAVIPDSDGRARLFGHVSSASAVTTDAFALAVAELVEGRNDYIVVWPDNSTYYIDAAIALAVKGCHLVAPSGLGNEIGATNAVRIQQITAATACVAISDASVEVSGIYFKNINGTAAITLAAGSYAPNIHHNTFPLIWTSGAQVGAIVCSGDGGAWGSIERNWMVSQSGGACTCAAGVIVVGAAATAARVRYNEITIGDTQTATIGISNAAVKGRTDFNIFSESGGSGVSDGGTITNCIAINVSGAATGNRCSVAAGAFASGGTAAHSFTDNTDGATGAGNGQASNLEA